MIEALMRLRSRKIAVIGAGLVALGAAACGNAGADRVLSIDANGVVTGLVYFDANATRQPDAGDDPLEGVRVALVATGTRDTVDRTTSDSDGLFEFEAVQVGSYRVVVDTTTIGDTTIVAAIDDEEVSIAPNDTTEVSIAISFPLLSVAEARALPVGRKVFLDGIALNQWATFGDSTVHVTDTSASVRAVRVGVSGVFPGDSVRIRGTVSTRSGQKVIDMDRRLPIILEIAEVPILDTVTTAVASTASAGALDAALVRMDSARVVDTATVNGERSVTVNDGSGELEIVLDKDVGFAPGPLLYLLPGADLAVSGVLVPTGTGEWRLKPRSDDDVTVTAPVISISDARDADLGTVVFVDGIVLNYWETFGDSTVHLAGRTGAIRGTRVRAVTVFPGDSVRFVGRIQERDGHPVIDDVTVFPLGFSRVPPPENVSTFEAAAARAGTLDADLVSIANARISAIQSVSGDLHATVDDGSGAAVVVVFDQDIPFNLVPYVPGTMLNVTGLLVPDGAGSWVVKPRAPGDVVP